MGAIFQSLGRTIIAGIVVLIAIIAITAGITGSSNVGAITLPMAGFCSSGILGIEGICTKLKYHSRPIHITPDKTCR